MSENLEMAVEGFLAHKRGIGRKYHSEEHELRLLLRFAGEHCAGGSNQLNPALLEEFLASRPRSRPRSFNHLLGVVAGLLDWAVTFELLEASPLQVRRRRVASSRVPFLFDATQARCLLQAAATLSDNSRARQRGPTYTPSSPCAPGSTARRRGLRAAPFRRRHRPPAPRRAGRQIRQSRLVPHGPRIARLVAEQVESRRPDGKATAPTPRCSASTASGACIPARRARRSIIWFPALGLAVPEGVSPPTLHSLRHSFAVGCLLRWYREGLDPQDKLHQLSTFMGQRRSCLDRRST